MKSIRLIKNLSPRFKVLVFLGLIAILSAPLVEAQVQSDQQPANRLITHPEPITALPSQNKRWALLIGVDRYDDSNIGPLRGAANDANSLKDVLIRYAGFPQDQVIVLSTNEPPERQPTRKNILKRLSNLSGLVPKDGLLLISFAGHGIDRNGSAFLIPSDATLTEDLGLLEETAVSVNHVKQRIKDTGVHQVMILLDACRAYPTGRSDSPNPLTPAFTNAFSFDTRNHEVVAFAVLYATAVGYRAYEYGEKHQGYFSWAITQALSGAAANDRGEVTLRALVKYLEETVPKLVALDYGAKVFQKPFADIEGYRADELILAFASSLGRRESVAPPVNYGGPNNPEVALWDSIKNSQNSEDFNNYLQKYPNGLFVEVAKDRLQQQTAALYNSTSRTKPIVTGLGSSAKAGKVLLTYGTLATGASNAVESYDEFLTPLIQSLRIKNLNVFTESALDQKDRIKIRSAVQDIKRGRKSSARSVPFMIDLDVSFSIQDLPAFNGMLISVANITLRAINLETGEIAVIENLESRGFGNDQMQARRNAITEAGKTIPKGFVESVAEASGRGRTNLGGGIQP